jgi:predicted RNase H-like HicB family nuclease
MVISLNSALEAVGETEYSFIMRLAAVLTPDAEGGFVAFNPETGTTTQGESIAEALANLKEATELYLEEFPLKSSGQPLLTTIEVGSA